MAITKEINIVVKETGVENINKKVETLNKNLKKTGDQAVETTENVSKMSKAEGTINTVGDAVGKLNPAFGAAIKGANGLLVKFWELVANPWGAVAAGIVVVMKFLYEAFQSSIAGGKEIKTVFAAISAVGEQVKDAIFGLGRALINVTTAAYKFITLDFKGAAEDMKKANGEATESFKQLGNASDGTTAKIIKNLTKQQQANDKARKMQAVVQAETNKLLVESRETLTDETASIKEKKKALEEVTKAEKASSAEKVRIAAEDLRIAKEAAVAKGGQIEAKSKQQLRELTIALTEAETENAMTGTKLNRQKKMLLRQEVSDAKEAADNLKSIADAKKVKAKEVYDADKVALEEALKEEGLSFEKRREMIKSDLLLNAKDRKKLNDEINKEEKKANEDHLKAIADLNKKYDDEKLNRLADTAVKKEDLDYSRQVKEIETLAKNELEKQTLIEKLNEEHLIRMGIAKKTDADNSLKLENEYWAAESDKAVARTAKQKEIDDKAAADKIQTEKNTKDALILMAESTASIFDSLEALGLKKSKAAQTIRKGIALAQIAVDTSTAISTAIPMAIKAGKEAASVAGPAAPFVGPLATAASYASSAALVFSNVAKAKQLLGSGGGGGGGNTGAGGGGGSAPQSPSFNLVQGTGRNQLAESIGQQAPVKAFVVARDMSTGQEMDRNIIKSASL